MPVGDLLLLARIVTRATKLLEARADALSLTDDEPALAHAHREATSGRGAIKHAPDDELDGQVLLPTRRKARIDGFDLDAEVAVAAHDHERREVTDQRRRDDGGIGLCFGDAPAISAPWP